MRFEQLTFTNTRGRSLAARLEFPVNQRPHTFALFAHCFTCSADLAAMRNISRALTIRGFAVLRFDFTGLAGAPASNDGPVLSSSVEDLTAAARYLEQHYMAPSLLIGHSIGGAAAIIAAGSLSAVRAVATIGAPADARRMALPQKSGHDLEADASMDLGGKSFSVPAALLEEISEISLLDHLRNFDPALLILHSPQDRIVPVDSAALLYRAARHPKSFISLDGADHLLSSASDSLYAGDVIASWAQRYINVPEKEMLQVEKQVATRLGPNGYTTDIMVRHHGLTSDEPVSDGGNDFGPSPYELLSAGLGACTAMTIQMYARRKKWNLREVIVHLEHYKDYAADMQAIEEEPRKIDHFSRLIELEGDLDESQRQRLLEIANRCPVHRTLEGEIKVKTTLKQ